MDNKMASLLKAAVSKHSPSQSRNIGHSFPVRHCVRGVRVDKIDIILTLLNELIWITVLLSKYKQHTYQLFIF